MSFKLLVFDSHPVQYRAPVWQAIEKLVPGSIHVIYASDCSIRGHADKGFGISFAWDEPMLTGYTHTILNCENGVPLTSWGSLTGKGVKQIIEQIKPDAIFLTGLIYKYDLVAYLNAKLRKVPVWLRCETQDEVTPRSELQNLIRSVTYRFAYWGISKFFYIGELNKEHYLRHGVNPAKLRVAHYGTIDRFLNFDARMKSEIRDLARKQAEVDVDSFVIGFCGKFIFKKNPQILFQMIKYLPENLRKKIHLYFMGSGELETELKDLAGYAMEEFGVKSFFAGFVNQSQLAPHYLAMDLMILPSRRMGETWGLVANEAMQAGCGVIVSDVVGCGADFDSWERFRVFKEGSPEDLAKNVRELFKFKRDFEWAKEGLTSYSIDATATSLVNEMKKLL